MFPRRLLTCFATAAILGASASGQTRIAPGFAQPVSVTPGFAGFNVISTTALTPISRPHPLHAVPVFFFSDSGYEPTNTQPITVVVVQPPPPAAPREEDAHPPAKPQLLELQGDHWVQVQQFQMTRNAVPGDKAAPTMKNPHTETLLVFRDGRSEATSGYAVIGDALYAQSNYGTGRSWTRKVPIADLDLPATLKANQQRGIVFKLPGGPNEVVVQP